MGGELKIYYQIAFLNAKTKLSWIKRLKIKIKSGHHVFLAD